MAEVLEQEFRFLDEMGRYDAFLRLYHSPEERGRKALEALTRSEDPLIPLILLRYLAEVPEKRAARMIIGLIDGARLVVARAAMASYRSNHYPGKARLLKELVLSRDTLACRFAVRTLSRAGFLDVLPLILRELPDREEPVRGEMLVALRYLPDPRCVPILMPLARSPREPTRYASVLALSELQARSPQLSPAFFLGLAQDESARVRRVALQALHRRSSSEATRVLLAQALDRSEDDSVRERAIRGIAAFPSTDVIMPMVSILAGQESASLKLAAEIVLRGLPPRILKGGLVRLLDASRPEHRRWAAVLLAQFLGGDAGVRAILLDLWAVADEESAVDLTEMLRELGGDDAHRLLLDALRRPPLVAYAAAGSLARILGAGSGPRILATLEDPGTPLVAKQALLAHWAKRAPDEGIRPTLLPWLLHALGDQVLNVRYLSLQTLAWYPLKDKLPALLDLLCTESSADVVRAAYRQILRGLGRDPLPFAAALARHPEPRRLVGHAVRILTGQSWDPAASAELLQTLKDPPVRLLDENPEAFFSICAHLIERRGTLLQTVWTILDAADLRRRFLGVLLSYLRNPRRAYPKLPLEFMEAQLAREGPEERILFCWLLEADGSPASAESLAAALVREVDENVRAVGVGALRRLLGWEPA